MQKSFFRELDFCRTANVYTVAFQILLVWHFIDAISTKINTYRLELTKFSISFFFSIKSLYDEVVKIHINYFKLKVTATVISEEVIMNLN